MRCNKFKLSLNIIINVSVVSSLGRIYFTLSGGLDWQLVVVLYLQENVKCKWVNHIIVRSFGHFEKRPLTLYLSAECWTYGGSMEHIAYSLFMC